MYEIQEHTSIYQPMWKTVHRHLDTKELNQPQQKRKPNSTTRVGEKMTQALITWVKHTHADTPHQMTPIPYISNTGFFSSTTYSPSMGSSFLPSDHKTAQPPSCIIPILFVSQPTEESLHVLIFCFHKPFTSHPH